jgi:hypothetical protein
MLIRDLKFDTYGSNWKYATARNIVIATPGPGSQYKPQGTYWIKKPGAPDNRIEWHEQLSEFEAQAVLDHYLGGNQCEQSSAA